MIIDSHSHIYDSQFDDDRDLVVQRAKQAGVGKNYRGRTDLAFTHNGKQKCPYSRILIRNKHPKTI